LRLGNHFCYLAHQHGLSYIGTSGDVVEITLVDAVNQVVYLGDTGSESCDTPVLAREL
jgi:hypothetical protein